MKWQEIPTGVNVPKDGDRALVSGFVENDSAKNRWYAVAEFQDGVWWDDEGNDLYPPTHFVPFEEVPA